jgi:hypothetical protein
MGLNRGTKLVAWLKPIKPVLPENVVKLHTGADIISMLK